jgi:hypothetical protein
MIALNVGCGGVMNWIQTFVMLSETKHLWFLLARWLSG